MNIFSGRELFLRGPVNIFDGQEIFFRDIKSIYTSIKSYQSNRNVTRLYASCKSRELSGDM